MTETQLRDFVRASNAIEGINRQPTDAEIQAHEVFLDSDLQISDLVALVLVLQPNAVLRDRVGVPGVAVGDHVAPPSGPLIRARLEDCLAIAADPDPQHTIYATHVEYETLHPFTDGNGRSGRALWLWQMIEQCNPQVHLGFLHAWYYQSLSGGR